MSDCKLLDGKNVAPRAKADCTVLIGRRVRYLRDRDIDKSGRGYFFPKEGVVERTIGREAVIDGDYVPFRSIVEMVILT